MKIIVDSEELKQEIIDQSKYIYDTLINKNKLTIFNKPPPELDIKRIGILIHLYMVPRTIEVDPTVDIPSITIDM